MARKVSFAPLSLFVMLASCELSLEGAPCPCASGQECCNDRCVVRGSPCKDSHEPDAGAAGTSAGSSSGASGGSLTGASGGSIGASDGGGAATSGGTASGADAGRTSVAGGENAGEGSDGGAAGSGDSGGSGAVPSTGEGGSGGDSQATDPIAPEYCTRDRWCGGSLFFSGIWGSALDDLWFVAQDANAESVLLHRTGEDWSTHRMGDLVENWDERWVSVRTVWGSASDDVWFAGDTFLHFDGDRFTEVPLADELTGTDLFWAQSLWGSSADDVWAVDGRLLVHWNGAQWSLRSERATEDLHAISGSSATDVWAVGDSGCAMHWNGSTWSDCRERAQEISTGIDLVAVWSRGENDTFAIGGPYLLHNTGASWAVRDLGLGAADFDGTALAAGESTVWVGGNGLIARDDAEGKLSFSRTDLNPVSTLFRFPSGEMWAAGNDSTAYFDGAIWSPGRKNLPTETLTAVWAVSETSVWAAGATGAILHFDGNSWTELESFGGNMSAIWGASEDDIWIAGSRFWHWDGLAWTEKPIVDDAENTIDHLWGTSSDDVWAVGSRGGLYRLEGENFAKVEVPTAAKLESIWGSGPDDVWLTAWEDGPWHWDGDTWSLASIVIGDERRYPLTVVGSAENDVWFLGSPDRNQRLEVSHWTGSAWVSHDTTLLPRGGLETPVAWVSSDCKLWVLGGGTAGSEPIGHFDGSTWRVEDSGATYWLEAITGTAQELWAVGDFGTIVRRRVDSSASASSCGVETSDPLACEPGVEEMLTEPCGACDAGTRRVSRACTAQRRWSAWTSGECEGVDVVCEPSDVECCTVGGVVGTRACSASCVWAQCTPCSGRDCAC